MEICWDTLENIRLTKNGTFKKGNNCYIYKESCICCGHPYLTVRSYNSNFCSRACAEFGTNNHRYGKGMCGENNPMYKGGVISLKRPLYVTYAYRLQFCENVRRSLDNNIFLDAKCVYCNAWFSPSLSQVVDRVRFIAGKKKFEAHFYCSENCKKSCPIYNQKVYPKGFKKAIFREVDPYLRKMCFERDNWECQICGKMIKQVQLHCHHIEGYTQNPLLGNDIDNVITLCKDCHKKVHKLPGCNYYDLRCN